MHTGNPIQILVIHNRWANQNLIDACAELTEAQFHEAFEMGCGSLHDNLVHILGAMRGWADLLGGREQRPRLEGQQYSIDQIRKLHTEISEDLEQLSLAHPADEEVTGERGGRSFTFKRGGVVVHVTTHGMHHRAQCLNMLKQLGVTELPKSSVVEWMMAGGT